MVKRKNPYKPFNDAVQNNEKEESKLKDPLDLNPPIKKDNTAYIPKPPSFANGGTTGTGARGTMGYKDQWTIGERVTASPEIDVTKGDPETDLWIHGKLTSMDGYRFIVKVYDAPSVQGIGGGNISKLQLWKDDQTVAAYDRGWGRKPETPEAKLALEKICDVFDTPSREASKTQSFDKDKGHDIDR